MPGDVGICSIPPFMSLEKTTETPVQDISLPEQAGHAWAGMWETFFNIVHPGVYDFKVQQNKDTSTSLWIGGHQVPVLETSCEEELGTGSLQLDQGSHNLKLLFYDWLGYNASVELLYRGPDTGNVTRRIPVSVFLPGVVCAAPCPAPPPPPPCPGSLVSESSETTSDGNLTQDTVNQSLSDARSIASRAKLDDGHGTSSPVQVHRSNRSTSSDADSQSLVGSVAQQSWQRSVQHHSQFEKPGHHSVRDRRSGKVLSVDGHADGLAI